MNPIAKACVSAFIMLSSLSAFAGPPGPETGGDKTLSPYFFVKSDDPQTDQLPLQSTSAAVDIAGVIADVKVTQVYKNEGKRPIEAVYVFPASTRAAVYAMTMTIGKRVITAEIKKRDEARSIYEQARQEGRSASLLEQQRPNVFQMNVANILPGDVISVDLRYTELLIPEEGEYEFVYPTVVGPRYTTQTEDTSPPSERWLRNPYLHEGEAPTYAFGIAVGISAGLPIQEISCPSHKVTTNYEGRSLAAVKLDASEKNGGNRDFILKYRLSGKKIDSGFLLYEGQKENFFLLTVQPPERVTAAQIPGREYIFIVDVSGSMYGFPLEISKKLLKDLIGGLRPSDMFNVLLFAGGNSVLSEESLPATPENISKAVALIERQRGGGGTELLPALKRALSLPRPENYSRTVVIATDGYVSVEAEAFDLIRKSLGQANMFAFGIGTSVNRHLIEGMARAGMGEPFIVTKPDEAPAKAEALRRMVQSPVLTGIKADFGSFDVYDVEPPSIPDVLAERPVIIFGKWHGRPKGTIAVSGTSGTGPYKSAIDVAGAAPTETNSALRYLWARHRIASLSDFAMLRRDDEAVKEVTSLGLTYNLLTAYTSFVAADTEVRNRGGEQTTIRQPLPLPQGVSDYAVGGSMAKAASLSPAPGLPHIMQVPAEAYRGRSESMALGARPAREDAMKKPAEPPVKIVKVVVSGGLAESDVRKAIQDHMDDLRACAVKDGLRGRLVMTLNVAPDGTIHTVQFVVHQERRSDAEKCLMKKVRAWRFPAAQGPVETKATVTLVFPG